MLGQEIGADDRLVDPVCDDQGEEFTDPAFLQLDLQEAKIELTRDLSRTAALPKVRLSARWAMASRTELFENRFDWFGGVGLLLQVPITVWRDHAREEKSCKSNRTGYAYTATTSKKRDIIKAAHSGEIYRYETLENRQIILLEKKGKSGNRWRSC